ncbi:MAG TPA: isochorismatase family cysteine hydrolase [Sphingomonas sp.]|jgi:nicotinamidase-related amidase|uniref:cysteine hydrolase family protein n=1 Tax=Sphingomonas sp. TaxID=28214 RepID=UPI002EDB1BBE
MADQGGEDARTEEREPATGGTALLIIDMLNTLDFAGGEAMLPAATAAADAIRALRDKADAAGVPVVYVNDNYDQWHSERSRLVELCAAEDSLGRPLAERLAPRPDDYFVIKPQFSGFYSTNLPVLLPRLAASRLILTGVAADICILFTAADAHMREYELWVPEDAVAATDPKRTSWALEIMRDSMKADTRPTDALTLDDWIAAA